LRDVSIELVAINQLSLPHQFKGFDFPFQKFEATAFGNGITHPHFDQGIGQIFKFMAFGQNQRS